MGEKYRTSRTKIGYNVDKLKTLLMENQGEGCKCCKKWFDKSKGDYIYLELDHKIPYKMAPELVNDLKNLQLLCRKCHCFKSGNDRKIMNYLKKKREEENGLEFNI